MYMALIQAKSAKHLQLVFIWALIGDKVWFKLGFKLLKSPL